jgi:hypothetical protein
LVGSKNSNHDIKDGQILVEAKFLCTENCGSSNIPLFCSELLVQAHLMFWSEQLHQSPYFNCETIGLDWLDWVIGSEV